VFTEQSMPHSSDASTHVTDAAEAEMVPSTGPLLARPNNTA